MGMAQAGAGSSHVARLQKKGQGYQLKSLALTGSGWRFRRGGPSASFSSLPQDTVRVKAEEGITCEFLVETERPALQNNFGFYIHVSSYIKTNNADGKDFPPAHPEAPHLGCENEAWFPEPRLQNRSGSRLGDDALGKDRSEQPAPPSALPVSFVWGAGSEGRRWRGAGKKEAALAENSASPIQATLRESGRMLGAEPAAASQLRPDLRNCFPITPAGAQREGGN